MNFRLFTYPLALALLLGGATAAHAKKTQPAPDAAAAAADDKDKDKDKDADVETGKARAKEISGKELDKTATEAKVGKIDKQVTDLDKALKADKAAPAEAVPSSRKARLAAEAAAAEGKKSKDAPVDPKLIDPKAKDKDKSIYVDPKAPGAAETPAMTRKQRLAAAAAAAAAEAAKKAAENGK